MRSRHRLPSGAEDGAEADLARYAQGGDVRQRAADGEGIAFVGNEGIALEHAAQAFDAGDRPMREVARGALMDPAVLPVGLAQQDSGGKFRFGTASTYMA